MGGGRWKRGSYSSSRDKISPENYKIKNFREKNGCPFSVWEKKRAEKKMLAESL